MSLGASSNIGKYIVVEGFDGTGKSTVIDRVLQRLNSSQVRFAKVNYLTSVPTWLSKNDLECIISHSIPPYLASDIRVHRFLMQYRYFVEPYLKTGVTVIGDRGPASILWSTQQFSDMNKFYLESVKEILARVDHHIILTCAPNTCYERIVSYRPLNRLEMGGNSFKNLKKQKQAFFSQHVSYYQTIKELMVSSSFSIVNCNQAPRKVLGEILELISTLVGNDSPDPTDLTNEIQQIHLSHSNMRPSKMLDHVKSAVLGVANWHWDSPEVVRDKLLQMLNQPNSTLETHLKQLVKTGRVDIEEILYDIVKKLPLLIRPISNTIAHNPSLLTERMLEQILLDEDARSSLVCQLASEKLKLPSFERIVSMLAEKIPKSNAISISFYVKGCEGNCIEVLGLSSFLFSHDIRIMYFATHAWISCGFIKLLPETIFSNRAIHLQHLLTLHKFQEFSDFPIKATFFDKIFRIDEKFTEKDFPLLQVIINSIYKTEDNHWYCFVKATSVSDHFTVYFKAGKFWKSREVSRQELDALPHMKFVLACKLSDFLTEPNIKK